MFGLNEAQVGVILVMFGGLLLFERRLAKVEAVLTMLAARCPYCAAGEGTKEL